MAGAGFCLESNLPSPIKNVQEKKDADKMNNERMQEIQQKHNQDKQVLLWRAVSCVCLTMLRRRHAL